MSNPRAFRFNVVAQSSVPAWVSALNLSVGQVAAAPDRMLDYAPIYPAIGSGTFGNGNIYSYSGGRNCPGAGSGGFGAYVMYGGGHSDHEHEDAYKYDYGAGQWSRIIDPYAAMVIGPDGYYANPTYAEWYSAADGTPSGIPTGTHSYGRSAWVPNGAISGAVNSPLGYFIHAMCGNAEAPPAYWKTRGWRLHYIPLSAPAWYRYQTMFPDMYSVFADVGAYNPTWFDPVNNLVCNTSYRQGTSTTGESRIRWINTATGASGTTQCYVRDTATTTYPKCREGTAFYDTANNVVILGQPQTGSTASNPFTITSLRYVSSARAEVYEHASAGELPTYAAGETWISGSGGGGFEWHQATGRLIYKHTQTASPAVWYAERTNPADPLNTSWTWVKVPVSGASFYSGDTSLSGTTWRNHCTRLAHIAEGYFMWFANAYGQQVVRLW